MGESEICISERENSGQRPQHSERAEQSLGDGGAEMNGRDKRNIVFRLEVTEGERIVSVVETAKQS